MHTSIWTILQERMLTILYTFFRVLYGRQSNVGWSIPSLFGAFKCQQYQLTQQGSLTFLSSESCARIQCWINHHRWGKNPFPGRLHFKLTVTISCSSHCAAISLCKHSHNPHFPVNANPARHLANHTLHCGYHAASLSSHLFQEEAVQHNVLKRKLRVPSKTALITNINMAAMTSWIWLTAFSENLQRVSCWALIES